MLTFQALGELWLVLAEEEREEFNKFKVLEIVFS
jgi:hypothetical protein